MKIFNFLKQGKTIEEIIEKQVYVYRIILFVCAAFPLLLHQFNDLFGQVTYDPRIVRFGFAFVFAAIFVLSWIQPKCNIVANLTLPPLFTYSFYLIFLVVRNNFNLDFLLEFILFVVVASRTFTDRRYLLLYSFSVFAGYTICSMFYIPHPLMGITSIAFLLLILLTIVIFFEIKLRVDKQGDMRAILLQATFEESPDAIFLIDSRFMTIRDCNQAAMKLFAYDDKAQIKGVDIEKVLPGYSLKEGKLFNEVDSFDSRSTHEFELENVKGSKFFGSIAFRNLKIKEEECLLLRISDITERVTYKRSVEENSRMLRQLIDLLPHSVFLKDSKGKFLFTNKIFLAQNDLKETDVLGKTDYEILQSEEALVFMQEDQEVIHTGEMKFIETQSWLGKDGKEYIYQTTKLPFQHGGDQDRGLLGISIDISERIRNKKAIEESRSMLMQILNLLPHNIFLKESCGKFLFVNEKAAEFHGLTPSDILGKTYADLYSPQQAAQYEEEEKNILEEKKPKIVSEEISIDGKGKVQVKTVIKMPFPMENSKIGILGIIIDITDFKLNEKALKESELKYKMLMEQASDGIYLSDQHGNILEANPKACDMFGYAMEEFMRLNIKKLIDPRELKDTPLKSPEIRDKQSIIMERRFLKKNGSPFTVELSAKLLENGKHQAIIRDITERKRIERVLKENEKKFRALIENSSDIILIISETFKIKFASPSIERILGYSAEAVVGKSVFDFASKDELDKVSKLFSDSLIGPGKKIGVDELKIVNDQGQKMYFEIVAVNLLYDSNINGIIINCHDITKRKTTEIELLNTNYELDSFVYKASHDLKAPLRSVMGLIRLAKLESKDETLNVYLDMMSKSVLSLDTFIKDLTQFSRNSRMEVEAKIIQFDELIDESLSNLLYMENANLVRVKRNIQIKEIFHSDPTRLGTIINNLLSNAFKYHRFENNNPYINIQIEADRERVLIILEDNGIGIDTVHIDRIFDMFYRAAETSYGSGLGLYIVKNAVVKLNGTIEVLSELGKGTTFKIIIPNLINKL